MFFSPMQKLFGRTSQPSRRRPPARFRPWLEALETRLVPAVLDVGAGETYTTIGAAVAAAHPGDIIKVDPGTYAEQVNVNVNDLTIEGANAGINPVTGTRGAESIVTGAGNGGKTPFYVTANDVTIDGFTIEEATNDNQFGYGILLSPATHGSTVINNIITDNIVGIGLANNSSTDQTLIQYNLIENNNEPGASSGTGIYTDEFVAGGNLTNVLIDSNTFTGNDNSAVILGATTDNSFPGTTPKQSAITISNNVMDGNGSGVFVSSATNASITSDKIVNSTSGDGVFIGGGVNGLTITNDQISGNDGFAINIGPDVSGNAGFFSATNSNITANYDNIENNTAGAISITPGRYTGTLDATYNWWGSTDGPAPGSIIGNVNYTPWLIAPANTSSTLFWHDGSGDVLMVDTSTGNYAFFLADGEVFSGTNAVIHHDKLQIRSLREMGQIFLARGPLDGEIKANLTGRGNEVFYLTPFTPGPVD
ncbi:MAG TPA: hypothetical protein VMG10_22825 [Gemmataceae bacterium]|nr:hypothetical protein [Gemmataceae bacterium]